MEYCRVAHPDSLYLLLVFTEYEVFSEKTWNFLFSAHNRTDRREISQLLDEPEDECKDRSHVLQNIMTMKCRKQTKTSDEIF